MKRLTALAALLPLALAAGWWTWGADTPWSAEPLRAAPAAAARVAASPAQSRAAPAPAAAADGWLTPALRQQIDALWLEATEASDPETLKAQLLAAAARHFPAAHLTRARELIGRYVDYRVAVSRLKPPGDVNDPRALQQALQARTRLRQQHFTEEEHEALFAQEEALDRFTIARLEILRHPDLSPAQRQAALREAEATLADNERSARRQAVLHEAVAAQTARFDVQGTSEAERHAQRRAAWGDEVATRLAQLDAQERHWQDRLARYDGAPAAERERLAQALFTPEEQLRLPAALQMRKQPK